MPTERRTHSAYVYWKHELQQTTKKTNNVRPSHYLCCTSYRNMKYAN